MNIKIFITGGTIDKIYNDKNGLLEFDKTNLSDMLSRARIAVNISIEELMLVDSLEMSHKQRNLIVDKVTQCSEQKVLITHGTDTMCETAKLLHKKIKNKTIVLVGSMIPYRIKNSDAMFNLGSAIASIQLLEKGVYIAMNGRVLPANNVIKNKKLAIFEKLH